MTTTSLNSHSYLKILLHASKYPHCGVFGFLLGTTTINQIDVLELFPVSHSSSVNSILLDMSARTAEEYCMSKAMGLKLVGVYYAKERLDDDDQEVPLFVSKASEVMGGLVLELNNKRLDQSQGEKNRLVVIQRQLKVKEAKEVKLVGDAIAAIDKKIDQLLNNKKQLEFSDFEDFLDQPEKDFTNKNLEM